MQSSSERPIITLLSDYGSLYPAQMKGPILSRTRDAVLVDIAHDVPPQYVRTGAFGPRVAATDLEMGPAEISGDGMEAEVVYVDGFVNVITNAVEVPWKNLILAGRRLSRARTYAEAEPDEPLITIGSHGFAEIAVNGASAKDLFGLAPADRILLERGNCSE